MTKREIDFQEVMQELCRRKLSEFLPFTMASYKAEWFHEYVCDKIEKWYRGEGKNRLMVFMPPQHGKSQISTRHTPAWILGQNPDTKLGIAAYNGTVATKFSRDAQRIMDSEEYQSIFDTRIPPKGVTNVQEIRNNSEVEVMGAKGSIVSVGVGGGLTSRTIDVMIIDDVYKDHKEAWSPIQRKNVEEWYDTVVETRLHNDSKVLIVFTRWHEKDLGGHLLADQPEKWDVVKIPAVKTSEKTSYDPRKEGEALWPSRHSLEKILAIKKRNPTTFENLYQQDPQPAKGLLYGSGFKTYEVAELDKSIKKGSYQIHSYCDVADTGSDYLCNVVYIVKGELRYVIDVVYTQDSSESTEPLVAASLVKTEATLVHIESNSGGAIYGRNVKKEYASMGSGGRCTFKLFHQSNNKESRIFSNAHTVLNQVIMPEDWHIRWPDFYAHLTRYEKEYKKNEFHDCADVITGVVEKAGSSYGQYAYGK